MREILRNFPHCEEYRDDSFVGIWHEEGLFNEMEYWKLDKEIFDLSVLYCSENIPREIAWPLTRIFSYIMMSIQAHYNPNDGFQVENLDDLQMFEFRERLQLVIEGFFKGKMPKNKDFDLVNPLLDENT